MSEVFQHQSEEILALQSWHSLWPQLVVGFTTKTGGVSSGEYASLNLGLHVQDNLESVRLNRQKLADLLQFPLEKWVCCEQIHEHRIEKVTKNDCGKGVLDYESAIASADGLYTSEANVLLALCFADCVPLYFIAPKQRLVGIAHAGWRGTVKNISGEMVRIWKEEEHIPPDEIYAAIGPSIGACCYMVDDRVIECVEKVLGNFRGSPYNEMGEGQYALDLKELNKLLLLKAGVPEKNIIVSKYCTSCAKELFFSHRRDRGKTGRMMSFIGRKEEE